MEETLSLQAFGEWLAELPSEWVQEKDLCKE